MALNVNQPKTKLGFNATWSMAVGGMVGGGIFSTLGVVVGIAGPLALVYLALLVLVALFGRPALLRHVKTESQIGRAACRERV